MLELERVKKLKNKLKQTEQYETKLYKMARLKLFAPKG